MRTHVFLGVTKVPVGAAMGMLNKERCAEGAQFDALLGRVAAELARHVVGSVRKMDEIYEMWPMSSDDKRRRSRRRRCQQGANDIWKKNPAVIPDLMDHRQHRDPGPS